MILLLPGAGLPKPFAEALIDPLLPLIDLLLPLALPLPRMTESEKRLEEGRSAGLLVLGPLYTSCPPVCSERSYMRVEGGA